MIEPFEYERTRPKVSISENKVEDSRLETSLLDSQLENLNNFNPKGENQKFVEEQAPFSKAFQERVGRVLNENHNKSHYQSEAIAQLGSMNSEYDVSEFRNLKSRDNASVLMSRYLDSDVDFVPKMLSTVHSVDNLSPDEPVLSPGITFIDSRKNMATKF